MDSDAPDTKIDPPARRSGRWRRLWFYGSLLLLSILAIYLFRGMPPPARAAMRNADSFELLSLNPEHRRKDAAFHGFAVLGRATVSDQAARRRLYNALQSGARWGTLPASCFDPRHGIHMVSNGKTIDLLICFHCGQAQVWQDDRLVTYFTISGSPEPVFDQALRDAGLPVAPKSLE